MQARAIARGIQMSPRKARVVANLVRGKSVEEALAILQLLPKKGARVITKVLRSAIANAGQPDGDGAMHGGNSLKRQRKKQGKPDGQTQAHPEDGGDEASLRYAHGAGRDECYGSEHRRDDDPRAGDGQRREVGNRHTRCDERTAKPQHSDQTGRHASRPATFLAGH